MTPAHFRRLVWIIFHPHRIDALLEDREHMILRLVKTCNEYTLRLAKSGPNLQQITELREKARTEGAVAAYRHLKKGEPHEPGPIPNAD